MKSPLISLSKIRSLTPLLKTPSISLPNKIEKMKYTIVLLLSFMYSIFGAESAWAGFTSIPCATCVAGDGAANSAESFDVYAAYDDSGCNDGVTISVSSGSCSTPGWDSYPAGCGAHGGTATFTMSTNPTTKCVVRIRGDASLSGEQVQLRDVYINQDINWSIPSSTTWGDVNVISGAAKTQNGTNLTGMAITFTASGACTNVGTTVTSNSAGTCNISASIAGNANFAAATKATSWTVNKKNQSTTFNAQSTQTFSVGGTFPINPVATATSGLTTFTYGTSTPSVCSVSGTTVSINSAGTCTLTADQAGNANYNAAPQVSRSLTINKASQPLTFDAQIPASRVMSPSAIFTISPFATTTTTSGLSITYGSNSTGICTVAGATVTMLAAGTCILTANLASDTNYLAAQVTQNVMFTQGANSITFNGQLDQAYSPAGTFPITPLATSTSLLAPTYSSLTTGVCTVAGTTVTMVTAGTCTIAANQAGNTSYVAASQVTQSLTITKIAQSITFATQVTGTRTFVLNTTFALNPLASASSTLAISYSSLDTAICTISGTTVTMKAIGDCWIVANQIGDVNYSAAASVQQKIILRGDTDGDGVFNDLDNCPNNSNASQTNTDGDAYGDVCDDDDDNDSCLDVVDAAPLNAAECTDTDADGAGDNADTDDDADGILDTADNCPRSVGLGTSQLNFDAAEESATFALQQGDICDNDDDNDGYLDVNDWAPKNKTEWVNTDGDAQGDTADTDDDADGVLDVSDNCPISFSLSASQIDTDSDSKGNICDTNDDGDVYQDSADNCPFVINNNQLNTDSDAVVITGINTSTGGGDACDTDDDNDLILDVSDNCSTIKNGVSPNAYLTTASQFNTDGDSFGNACDTDDDNDGVADASDPFPTNSAEWIDTDNDGTGDNADTNDDGDTLLDTADNCPLIVNNNQANNDVDSEGDVCDADDDNDDVTDAFPDNCQYVANTIQTDTDADGIGNACERSYVKTVATGTGTCTSWANACGNIQTAIDRPGMDSVWIAKGIYKPATTIILKSGVKLYGGFAGTESALSQAKPTKNLTIISGDTDNNDTLNSTGFVISRAGVFGTNLNSLFSATALGTGTDNLVILDGIILNAAGGTALINGAALAMSGSSVLANKVQFIANKGAVGGAVSVIGGSKFTATYSTFKANESTAAGGAISLNAASGFVTLTNSVFDSNKSATNGGAISAAAGVLTVTNSTFFANAAGATSGNGGAINFGNFAESAAITFVTMASNTAGTSTGRGGAININNAAVGTVALADSLILNNTAAIGSNIADMGEITNNGYNMVGFNAISGMVSGASNTLYNFVGGTSLTASNVTSAEIVEPTLQDNGNYTASLKLNPTSPARDVIPNLTLDCDSSSFVTLGVDQRDMPRPNIEAGYTYDCDIGAFEFNDKNPNDCYDEDGDVKTGLNLHFLETPISNGCFNGIGSSATNTTVTAGMTHPYFIYLLAVLGFWRAGFSRTGFWRSRRLKG